MKLSEDLKRSLGFGFTTASLPISRSLLGVFVPRGMPEILSGVANLRTSSARRAGVN